MGSTVFRVEIWSLQRGRAEVNEIADDICDIVTLGDLCLEGPFRVTSKDVTNFESYATESHGYHGVLTITMQIQNLGG